MNNALHLYIKNEWKRGLECNRSLFTWGPIQQSAKQMLYFQIKSSVFLNALHVLGKIHSNS